MELSQVLLAAEITARMRRDLGEVCRELTRKFGEPVYDRVEAPGTPNQADRSIRCKPLEQKTRVN